MARRSRSRDIYLKLQAEYDNYQNIVADPKAAPQQGINAALISLAYLHVDDAIARFQKVMDKFCGAPEAAKAKDGILAIYEAQANFDDDRGDEHEVHHREVRRRRRAIQLAISQNRSLNFSRAADLYKEQQYIPAAESFYRFYKTAPNTDPDLPIALYNSAVSYKLADRPKTAIALFKEFTANPQKNFRESPYYLDAMRLTAASYQAAFDYDNAIEDVPRALRDDEDREEAKGIKAPDPLPGEQPRTLDQIGLDALFNAAFASELNRDFKRRDRSVHPVPPRRARPPQAGPRAVVDRGIYRQSGDVTSMTETFDALAREVRQRRRQRGRLRPELLRHRRSSGKKKGQTAQAKIAGQADDRRVEEARLDQERPRREAGR